MSNLLPALLLAGTALAESAPAFVDRWHAALAGDRREAVLEMMAPEVTVFESGEAENSRDEYATRHLDADMKFARSTSTTAEERRVVETGDVVLVLSQTRTAGTFQGRPVSSHGVETMALRRLEHGWRIVHIHWSSRRPPSPAPSPSPAAPR